MLFIQKNFQKEENDSSWPSLLFTSVAFHHGDSWCREGTWLLVLITHEPLIPGAPSAEYDSFWAYFLICEMELITLTWRVVVRFRWWCRPQCPAHGHPSLIVLIFHFWPSQTLNLEAQMCRLFSGLGFFWLGAFFNSACQVGVPRRRWMLGWCYFLPAESALMSDTCLTGDWDIWHATQKNGISICVCPVTPVVSLMCSLLYQHSGPALGMYQSLISLLGRFRIRVFFLLLLPAWPFETIQNNLFSRAGPIAI